MELPLDHQQASKILDRFAGSLTVPYRFPEVKAVIDSLLPHTYAAEFKTSEINRRRLINGFFQNDIKMWLAGDSQTQVQGLDELPYFYPTNGITHALEITFATTKNRLRFFKNDYRYYKYLCHALGTSFAFVADDSLNDLNSNDLLVVSHPNSVDGNCRPRMAEILNETFKKNIPVFIDCAYFGSVPSFCLDVTPNVIGVAFSFSKPFAIPYNRIGALFSRKKVPTFDITNQFGYYNISGIQMARKLMKSIAPSFLARTYGPMQKKICDQLNIRPSQTIWLGIDLTGKKVCISEYFEKEIERREPNVS